MTVEFGGEDRELYVVWWEIFREGRYGNPGE
jgi:hypothetical protein